MKYLLCTKELARGPKQKPASKQPKLLDLFLSDGTDAFSAMATQWPPQRKIYTQVLQSLVIILLQSRQKFYQIARFLLIYDLFSFSLNPLNKLVTSVCWACCYIINR